MRRPSEIGFAGLFIGIIFVGAAAFLEAEDSDLRGRFRAQMKIDFEVEEINIPGWEGGAYSEAVGGGTIDLGLVFAPDGGFPEVQVGRAKMLNYGCEGPAECRCTAPNGLFKRSFSPILFENVLWDPQLKLLVFRGPVSHPKDLTTIQVDCPGISTGVEDHPIYKLLGAFSSENTKHKDSGFSVSLKGKPPWEVSFSRELYGLGPKVFRANIVITVVKGELTEELSK